MPISFPIASHLHEMSDNFDTLEASERTAILVDACTIIENKLKDADYLKRFTWNGQQAFYNDHSESLWSTAGYHLADNFYISVDQTETNLLMYNPKTVSGAKGDYNLFEDLLWPGFGRYRVPTALRNPTKEDILKGSKAFQRHHYKTGAYFMQPEAKLMSFYYRYMGKSFYNMVERRGMDSSLHNKFHEYIIKAIEEGLKEAIESHVGKETAELLGGE